MIPARFAPQQLSDAAFLDRARSICTTKAAFTTRTEAKTFVRRRGYTGEPYLCPWCEHWHITTHDRARAKAFRRRLKRLMRTPEDASQT
jgi:hypothetical protein